MRYLVLVVVAALVLLLSTFGVQNPFPVSVRFLSWQSGNVPLYIIILISALVGILLATLLGLPGQIQRRLEARRLRQRVGELEQQVSDLKARLPTPVMKPLPDELVG